MAISLIMPQVGETVTEGTIERWLKQPGERVEKYEPLVEVNTDKVNVELPAPASGTLKEIVAEPGTSVGIGAVLATIEEEAGEAAAAAPPAAAPPEAGARARTPPTDRGARARGKGGRARATPRVRSLARQHGIDLGMVRGSGPGGRITEADVLAAVASRPGEAPAAAPAVAVEQEEERIPLTGIRRTIAQRMAQSVATAPHALLVVECEASGLVQLRESQRGRLRQKEGIDLTYLPFVVKAAAESLREHPFLNASWGEDEIVVKKRIHINIAVATEQGLQVPVIHDADRQSITTLARTANDLSSRARDGKLHLEDVQGGTFTVDNTGAFGSVLSAPIINLGQAAILTMELIAKRPVVVAGDKVAVRSMMNLCISFDHRVVDGAQAGAFLQAVKRRLEAFGPKTPIE